MLNSNKQVKVDGNCIKGIVSIARDYHTLQCSIIWHFKSLNAGITLSFLLIKAERYDFDTEFSYSIQQLSQDLGLTQRAIRIVFKQLEKEKILIKTSKQGNPPYQFYLVDTEKVAKIYKDYIQQVKNYKV